MSQYAINISLISLAGIMCAAILWLIASFIHSRKDHLSLKAELSQQIDNEFSGLHRFITGIHDRTHLTLSRVDGLVSQVGGISTHVEVTAQGSLDDLHAKVDAIASAVDAKGDAIAAAGDQLGKAISSELNAPEAESGTAAAGAGDQASPAAEADAKA